MSDNYDISDEEKKYHELKNFIENIRENVIDKNPNIYLLPALYKTEHIFDLNKTMDRSYSYFIQVNFL